MDRTSLQLAEYASSVRYEALSDDVKHDASRRLLDTLGCAIGAVHAPTSQILRGLAAARQTTDGALVLGTRLRTSPEFAAFANSALVRYLDFNDRCLGGHPSDYLPAALAAADARDARVGDCVAGVVVAYDVFAILGASFIRRRGWDQGSVGAIASACAAGRVLGLDRDALAHAIAIAASSNISLREIRVGELSMWKGVATPYAAQCGVLAAVLAEAGMTGPEKPFEGEYGFFRQVSGEFVLPVFDQPPGSYGLVTSDTKFWPVEYNAQLAVHAGAELRKEIAPDKIAELLVKTHNLALTEIGSGHEKWDPKTRETADHSLPYILATALITGTVGLDDFDPQRFRDPQRLALMAKIRVAEDPAITAAWPRKFVLELEVTTTDGQRRRFQFEEAKGRHTNPMSDAELEQKFRALAHAILPDQQASAAIEHLWRLDSNERVRNILEYFSVPGMERGGLGNEPCA